MAGGAPQAPRAAPPGSVIAVPPTGLTLSAKPADSSVVNDVISIIDERAVDPHAARATLDRYSSRAREGLVGALCALIAGVLLTAVGKFGIAIPAGLGAGAGVLVWLHARSDRKALVLRLVSQRGCYDIPEVEAAAARMATSELRRSLSRALTRTVMQTYGLEPHQPAKIVLGERVDEHCDEILAIAYLLARDGVRIHPAALALCGRMVDSTVRSPLYNPRVPEQHLRIALQRIRASIS
jgi:hypothetical protein